MAHPRRAPSHGADQQTPCVLCAAGAQSGGVEPYKKMGSKVTSSRIRFVFWRGQLSGMGLGISSAYAQGLKIKRTMS